MHKYVALFYLFFNVFVFSQKQEIFFDLSYGVATNKFKVQNQIGLLNYDFNRLTNSNYINFETLYSYTVSKKMKLSILTGFSIEHSKYVQNILDNDLKLYDNIVVRQNSFTFNILGLNKKINIFKDLIVLNLNLSWIERLFFHKQNRYKSDFKQGYDYYLYSYDLTTYKSGFYNNHDGVSKKDLHFNLKYEAFFSFKFGEKSHVNLGVSYLRNYVFFYDYNYELGYFSNNGQIDTTDTFIGYADGAKFGVKNNFLSPSLGFSFKF